MAASIPTSCRRHPLILLCILIAVGLLVRMAVIPKGRSLFPVDAVYYEDVGRNIAQGRGIVADYAWCYVRGVPRSLPEPAHGYWMPGMSLFLGAWYSLFGCTTQATQLACLFLSVPFMLLTWWTAREVTQNEAASLFAVGLCAVDPNLLAFAGSPDAAILQAILGTAGLMCIVRGLSGKPLWFLLAGLLCGGAHLARNDGVLLPLVFALCMIAAVRERTYEFRGPHLLYFVATYLAVVLPWLVRSHVTFQWVGPAHFQSLPFLPRYQDLFRVDLSTVTFSAFVKYHGGVLGVIWYEFLVLARIVQWILTRGASILALVAIMFVWVRRPSAARPGVYLFTALTAGYTFVLPEIGVHGAYSRSFMSLLAWLFSAAAGGVWLAGEWLSKRAPILAPAFSTACVGAVVMAVTVVRGANMLVGNAALIARDPFVANQALIRSFSANIPRNEPILTDDPWLTHAFTGRPCLMLPTDGLHAIQALGRSFGVRHIVAGRGRDLGPEFAAAVADGRLPIVKYVPGQSAPLVIYDLGLLEARTLNEKGMQAAGRGDFEEAIRCFRAALLLVSDHSHPRQVISSNLARALIESGTAEEEKAAALTSPYDTAMRLMHLRDAFAKYQEALRVAPAGFDVSKAEMRIKALRQLLLD